jgi:hypothetical protein
MTLLTTNEGEEAMDHNEVVRQKLTERYLLAELEPEARDQFEEHFFDCPECALDVRAGSQFVTGAKMVLAETSETSAPQKIVVRNQVGHGWFSWLTTAWLRPAFAVPGLAVLLAVMGYQNLVTYPQLRASSKQAQVMPWAAVAVGTWGSSGPTIPLSPEQGFLLFVRIPPDGDYVHYTADLYNPAGRLECSLNIPAVAGKDQWPVLVPGANREPGNYRMAVRGVTASGESKDLGGTSFTLEIQK